MIKNKFIYYGIVMFYLIKVLFNVLRICIYWVIGYLGLTQKIIPIVLLLFCFLFLFFFFKTKTFNEIKKWQFISAILLAFSLSQLSVYSEFIMDIHGYEKGLIYSFVTGIEFLFLLSLAIIAYLKYTKIKD